MTTVPAKDSRIQATHFQDPSANILPLLYSLLCGHIFPFPGSVTFALKFCKLYYPQINAHKIGIFEQTKTLFAQSVLRQFGIPHTTKFRI